MTSTHGVMTPEQAEEFTRLRVAAKYAGIDYGHGSPRHMQAERELQAWISARMAR